MISRASAPIPGSLVLHQNTAGAFVNRWGALGEPWYGYPRGMVGGVQYPEPLQCNDVDCTGCAIRPRR